MAARLISGIFCGTGEVTRWVWHWGIVAFDTLFRGPSKIPFSVATSWCGLSFCGFYIDCPWVFLLSASLASPISTRTILSPGREVLSLRKHKWTPWSSKFGISELHWLCSTPGPYALPSSAHSGAVDSSRVVFWHFLLLHQCPHIHSLPSIWLIPCPSVLCQTPVHTHARVRHLLWWCFPHSCNGPCRRLMFMSPARV